MPALCVHPNQSALHNWPGLTGTTHTVYCASLQTLDGHAHNIATVCFHPELPLILTGSEDGTVKLWHSTT